MINILKCIALTIFISVLFFSGVLFIINNYNLIAFSVLRLIYETCARYTKIFLIYHYKIILFFNYFSK